MGIARKSTGIPGLDRVLRGGFISTYSYLIRGGPGSGKTTLGIHLLTKGSLEGEKGLYISLSEPIENIKSNFESMGFIFDKIEFLDLTPGSDIITMPSDQYSLFSPSDVERDPITNKIIEKKKEIEPHRIFIDSMTQFRYLTQDVFQFRKQVLSFFRFLKEHNITCVFTSERSPDAPDEDLQFIADGIIELENNPDGRTIAVKKFRGSDFLAGKHTMVISEKGIKVFPRLVPEKKEAQIEIEPVSSGVPEIDELLGGGVERGTVTIISGPSGVGKSTLGMQFIKEAAGRGENSAVYLFDEDMETLLMRCDSVNIPAYKMIEKGTLLIRYIESLNYGPDEFSDIVRKDVKERDLKIVMIDSLSGYKVGIRGGELTIHLHALCRYLKNLGITVILINEITSIVGDFKITEIGASYLADNIIFLRYLEINGELQKAIGVLKKRLTDFEKSLRKFDITKYGIKVGEPLKGLKGILQGIPDIREG